MEVNINPKACKSWLTKLLVGIEIICFAIAILALCSCSEPPKTGLPMIDTAMSIQKTGDTLLLIRIIDTTPTVIFPQIIVIPERNITTRKELHPLKYHE